MTTTTENGTALAVGEWSLAAIARRIDLAKTSGWGLQGATQAQLNMLALYCQKRQLLPGDEVILYEGNPFITVDGHVTLMRRDHKDDYRGFSQRPLSRSEKEDWGYDPDDLVVETTIRSVTMGEIKTLGKVSADERNGRSVAGRRNNPVARFNPVEMAQKRSFVRAHRLAYGMDSYVDEEEFQGNVRTVIEERNDPQRTANNAAEYDRLFGAEYQDDGTGAEEGAAPMVTSTSSPEWKRWQAVVKQAHAAQIEVPAVALPLSVEALNASIDSLREMIADAEQAPLV